MQFTTLALAALAGVASGTLLSWGGRLEINIEVANCRF